MFNEIMALVHDRSTEKRTALFRMISDLFAEDAELHSDRELLLFGDVLSRLLDQVAVVERVRFSERVAPMPVTPRAVVMRLADDEDQVAAPVLQHSPVLTDGDLVDLVLRKGNSHRIAIARRARIAEAVTDALVDHGDGAVLTAVSANFGARFSRRSMGILADRATTSQRLAEALSLRSDMPPVEADNLLKMIGPASRARLETLLRGDGPGLEQLMDDAGREVDEARPVVERNRAEAVAMAQAVRRGRRNVDTVVDSLIHQRRMLDLSCLLADLCDVPEAHVNAVLFKLDSQPIAVLARVAGIGEAVYTRLTRLRCERLSVSASQEAHMMSVYRATEFADADKALEFHRKRTLGGQFRMG